MAIKWKYVWEFYGTIGVPVVYAFGLVCITRGYTLLITPVLQILGIVGSVAGIILWIVSYITLASSFGVLPRPQQRVTRGIYAVFRHPMYVGISLTYLSLALANQSRAGIAFTVFLLVPLLLFRAYHENKLLSD